MTQFCSTLQLCKAPWLNNPVNNSVSLAVLCLGNHLNWNHSQNHNKDNDWFETFFYIDYKFIIIKVHRTLMILILILLDTNKEVIITVRHNDI